MRPLLLLPLFAAATASSAAQTRQAAPAFEMAISPWVGITSFGRRQSAGNVEATYRSSVTLGVRGEIPLMDRVGLLANLGVSPVAKQRVDNPVSTELRERVTVLQADLALAWRFVPRAPVFFYAGGGVMRSSLPAFPDFDETAVEPRGLFGLGFDRVGEGPWNFRLTATGFLVKPAEPDPANWTGSGVAPTVEAESTAFDWAIELGARYRIRRGS